MTDTTIDNVMDNSIDEDKNKKLIDSPQKKHTRKMKASVNYAKPSKNKTSISFLKNGKKQSVFIPGVYSGELEIEYTGKEFLSKNIVSIK